MWHGRRHGHHATPLHTMGSRLLLLLHVLLLLVLVLLLLVVVERLLLLLPLLGRLGLRRGLLLKLGGCGHALVRHQDGLGDGVEAPHLHHVTAVSVLLRPRRT